MLDPIVRTIEVPCNQETAFRIFIEEMGSWWPLAKFTQSAMSGHTAQTVKVDPQVGGKIVEIGPNEEEILWGSIKVYEPFSFLRMDFHIPLPTERVKERSLVEIQFIAISEERTKVILTQSNWEAFGKRGPILQGGYGGGWIVIFDESYYAECVRVSNLQINENKRKEK